MVVSEGERILYSVLSKPFTARVGMTARWEIHPREVPAKSVTRRFNASEKVVAEERGAVPAKRWFSEASGELAEEVIGLGRYGKTLTVLSVSG